MGIYNPLSRVAESAMVDVVSTAIVNFFVRETDGAICYKDSAGNIMCANATASTLVTGITWNGIIILMPWDGLVQSFVIDYNDDLQPVLNGGLIQQVYPWVGWGATHPGSTSTANITLADQTPDLQTGTHSGLIPTAQWIAKVSWDIGWFGINGTTIMGPVAIGSLAQWRMIPNEWTYDVASDVPWDFGFGSFIVGVQFTCANLNLP